MRYCKVFAIICFLILLCGCSVQKEGMQNNLSATRLAEDTIVNDKSEEERAQIIKENILKVEKLKGASVVIQGHTALIGLRIEENNAKEIERIKKEASRLAKEADTAIESTAITSNEEIASMIEEMEREQD